MRNPYVWRGPVRQREMFFGRLQELQQISAFLNGHQSISVIGPRKIGKTSLLFQLMRREVWPALRIADNVLMTYLDCEVFGDRGPVDIFQTFAWEIAQTLAERGLAPEPALEKATEKPSRLAFEAAVRKLAQRDLRVVLLLDEFERLSSNELLDINFFNALRAVAGRYPLVFITSSARPLLELTYANQAQDILSSPFFNIFASLFMGLFPEEDARQLLTVPLAGADSAFPRATEDRLYALAGGHPFVLQVTAFHALEQHGELTEAVRCATRELESHFLYYWQNLSAVERDVLRNLPKASAEATSSTQLRTVYRDLTHKCHVVKRDEGYRYPYEAWASFVDSMTTTGAVFGSQDTVMMDVDSSTHGGRSGPVHFATSTGSPPQSNLGGYEIIENLGLGSMGEVYKGRHPRLDRTVAIKVLRSYLAGDANFRRRFEQEAQVVASLRHPHIVQIFDFGESDGTCFMVMEFVEGRDLAEYLREFGPLPLHSTRHLLRGVASALDYAHGRDLIHRDVKSSNLLLENPPGRSGGLPRAVLTDFGLSKLMNSTTMTQPGRFLGTPAYMAPEQILATDPIDKRADIYALGVVAYQMLTGVLPFETNSMMSSLWGHLEHPAPDPRAKVPSLPQRVALAIQRAMAKDPARRFNTAGELVEAFD